MSRKDKDIPKSVDKALRYIKQDAPMEKVRRIEGLLSTAITKRKEKIDKDR